MTLALPQLRTRYEAYAYAYPHKTAYRALTPPVPLADAWAAESRNSLFLYVHLPFCEMRCGFCNLFTLAQPAGDSVSAYLDTLAREAARARLALGPGCFTQAAFGGGTPTFLNESQLEWLFDTLSRTFQLQLGTHPLSVETSPRTATAGKMRLLKSRGATRVSIGVQSFIEFEVAAAGRAQSNRTVHEAIAHIRAAEIPTLNLDLIYGLPGQTVASFLHSLRAALAYRPEELYLYPLYVRPLTGIGRHTHTWDDLRTACYAEGRDFLLAEGYTQVSMRYFRAARAPRSESDFCCQDDGMVGIGCGARSYTQSLHYSREFAVGREGVKAILKDYIGRPDARFDVADYGCRLNAHEQRRRYIIKSILRIDGLSQDAYARRFGTNPLADLPELAEWIDGGYLVHDAQGIRPTPLGLDHSDLLGPRLFSAPMQALMNEFDLH